MRASWTANRTPAKIVSIGSTSSPSATGTGISALIARHRLHSPATTAKTRRSKGQTACDGSDWLFDFIGYLEVIRAMLDLTRAIKLPRSDLARNHGGTLPLAQICESPR